jgi:hypothetical protein
MTGFSANMEQVSLRSTKAALIGEIPLPQSFPRLLTARKIRPPVMRAVEVHTT